VKVAFPSELLSRRERLAGAVAIGFYAFALVWLGMTLAWRLPVAGIFGFAFLGFLADRLVARLPDRRELEARCLQT
jgi:hypothetical protein